MLPTTATRLFGCRLMLKSGASKSRQVMDEVSGSTQLGSGIGRGQGGELWREGDGGKLSEPKAELALGA